MCIYFTPLSERFTDRGSFIKENNRPQIIEHLHFGNVSEPYFKVDWPIAFTFLFVFVFVGFLMSSGFAMLVTLFKNQTLKLNQEPIFLEGELKDRIRFTNRNQLFTRVKIFLRIVSISVVPYFIFILSHGNLKIEYEDFTSDPLTFVWFPGIFLMFAFAFACYYFFVDSNDWQLKYNNAPDKIIFLK